jgi:hypothetical protein
MNVRGSLFGRHIQTLLDASLFQGSEKLIYLEPAELKYGFLQLTQGSFDFMY